jgi:hypothetical protein
LIFKRVPQSLIGKIIKVDLYTRLAKVAGGRSDGAVLTPNDVCIILGAEMAMNEWVMIYTVPSLWLRVLIGDRLGWFDAELTRFEIIDYTL